MSSNRLVQCWIIALAVFLLNAFSVPWSVSPTAATTTYPDAVLLLVVNDDPSSCDQLGWMWTSTTKLRADENHYEACVNGMTMSARCYDDTAVDDIKVLPPSGQRWLFCNVYVASPQDDDVLLHADDFAIIDSKNTRYTYDRMASYDIAKTIGKLGMLADKFIGADDRASFLLAFGLRDSASVPLALEFTNREASNASLYIILDLSPLTKNGEQSSPVATTTTPPTAVPPTTVPRTPTPRPRPTATTVVRVEPLNYQEEFYFQTMVQALRMVAAGMELLQQGGQVNRLTAASQWHAAYLFVLQMNVPPRMQGIHQALKDATSHFDNAATLMDDAFIYGQALDEAAWEAEVNAGYLGLVQVDDEITKLEKLTGQDLPNLSG